MGIEGTAAKDYFTHFTRLVSPFSFSGRVYHPQDWPVNVMLSFGYTILYNRIATAMEFQMIQALPKMIGCALHWSYPTRRGISTCYEIIGIDRT